MSISPPTGVKGYFERASPIMAEVYQIGRKKQQESRGKGSLGKTLDSQNMQSQLIGFGRLTILLPC